MNNLLKSFKWRPLVVAALMFVALANLWVASSAFGQDGGDGGQQKPGLSVSAFVGLGMDTNIYRSPSSPYFDYFANVAVTPSVQSGQYIPAELKLEYLGQESSAGQVQAAFMVNTNQYLDAAYKNANSVNTRLSLGLGRVRKQEGKKKDTTYFGVFRKSSDNTYTDHDTGLDKVLSGGDATNRYSYSGFGLEFEMKNHTSPLQWDVGISSETQDYGAPDVVKQYDNSQLEYYLELAGNVYKSGKLSGRYTKSNVIYTERLSRDINGKALTSNPPLKYDFSDLELTLRQKLAKGLVAFVDYGQTQRKDLVVGYNDYSQTGYKGRLLYDLTDTIGLKGSYETWNRVYPNGFAFDRVGQPQKTYGANKLLLKGAYAFSDQLELSAEYTNYVQSCSDDRYAYQRSEYVVGAEYTF